MRFYGLSESRVRRVIHSPKRIEEGIAPKTVAMMQPISFNWTQEIWVMLKNETKKKDGRKENVVTIISAWRYPGRTRPGQAIPAEILREVKNLI